MVMTQCDTGRYNFCSDEESLSVYVVLRGEDKKTIEVDGVRAVLYYSGDADEKDEIKDSFPNGIDYIFKKAFGYASRVISTTDYMAQCILFAKLYRENFADIKERYEEKEKERIVGQIERLKRNLESVELYNCAEDMTEQLEKEAAMYDKWASDEEKTAADLKENTESWKKSQEKIEKYRNKAEKLRSQLV